MDQRPILDHYGARVELDRLIAGGSRTEFERTKELLSRFLPGPPSVVDVGAGPGRYAAWLTHSTLSPSAGPPCSASARTCWP